MRHIVLASALALLALVQGCEDGNDSFGSTTSLTVVPTAAPEGGPGEMRQLALRATITEASMFPIKLHYSTSPGTATPGQDYVETSGSMTIPVGALSAYIPIEIIGDALEEDTETVFVDITIEGPAEPTATRIIASIANDDSRCDAPFSVASNPWRVHGADPLNFAHRGGVIDFPENTLFAYAEAAKAGADVLEMDVYQTKDNELVILHDLDVDRTTNGQGNVVDLTLAELRALDAAYWFVPGAGTPHDRNDAEYAYRGIANGMKPPPVGYSAEDFRIPTLEEALARFADNLINIELKPDLDGEGNYERQMAKLLLSFGRTNDMIAASFVDQAAENFKAEAPCIFTSVPLDQGTGLVFGFLGTGSFPEIPEHITWQVPPDTSQISQVDIDLEVVTPAFVAASHAIDMAVQVWTINSCTEMLRMIDLGVDAIMTDRPLLLEQILSTPPQERSCD